MSQRVHILTETLILYTFYVPYVFYVAQTHITSRRYYFNSQTPPGKIFTVRLKVELVTFPTIPRSTQSECCAMATAAGLGV